VFLVAAADKQECLSNKVSDKYKTDNNPVSANGSSSGLAGNSSIAVGERLVGMSEWLFMFLKRPHQGGEAKGW